MSENEAKARIKINKLLEEPAGGYLILRKGKPIFCSKTM
jgi:hypothetical protein